MWPFNFLVYKPTCNVTFMQILDKYVYNLKIISSANSKYGQTFLFSHEQNIAICFIFVFEISMGICQNVFCTKRPVDTYFFLLNKDKGLVYRYDENGALHCSTGFLYYMKYRGSLKSTGFWAKHDVHEYCRANSNNRCKTKCRAWCHVSTALYTAQQIF